MKPSYLILSLSLSLGILNSDATLNEPSTSVMAEGHWVKIRVYEDAIYELTYDKLRDLGFSNPERVNVFGYNSTLLMTHNENLIPADLSVIYTLHSSERSKLLFYGKGDTDFAPELWETPESNAYNHNKHAASKGATYFLSDAECNPLEISSLAAPASADGSTALTSHISLIYHEDDARNIAMGGNWFAGQLINASRPEETHSFEIEKLAFAEAEMLYSCMMSPEKAGSKNFLLATYSNGILSEESTGFAAGSMLAHEQFSRSTRIQKLSLPLSQELAEYSVTFSVHPQAYENINGAMLDFFALKYQRNNNLDGDNQVRMYFANTQAQTVEFQGMGSGDWQIWNVTTPMAPVKLNVSNDNDNTYCSLIKASAKRPNEVIAFNIDAVQFSPEIIGTVPNQNLHSIDTPDLLIVTSKLLMDSGKKIASFHKKHQGLDVAVVDQQQIFNEYSSGNVSAEGVRRFANHLYVKNPQKLKGLLLLGPGTYDQPMQINDESAYVVTAQCEQYISANKITTAYASDNFMGKFGTPITSGNWSGRCEQLQILANKQKISIGRLPFNSPSDIDTYYKKVEEYLSVPTRYNSIGNVLFASDYSASDEEHHLTNAEKTADIFRQQCGGKVTITHAASNLISAQNNTMTRTVALSGLSKGTSFFAYFGHGTATAIAGNNKSGDPLFDLTNCDNLLLNKGKYPIVYFGSCTVGPIDRSTNTLSNKMLANPNGGAISIIASGREVFQAQNQTLCQRLIKHMLSANDGTWIGQIFGDAQYECIMITNSTRDNIINHLTYNFLGDPAIPYRAETNSVDLDPVESLTILGNNTVTGSVLNSNKEVDADFNGTIVLTIYDVPESRANILGNVSSSKNDYYSSIELDQEVIGEINGSVTNGTFEVSFTGPTTVKQGNHRIQAYVCNNDGTKRGLGYLADIPFVEIDEDVNLPETEPSVVRAFDYANGMLTAEIYIPSGLAQATATRSPIILNIDGQTISRIQNYAQYSDGDIFKITYPVRSLTHGLHTATISILDGRNEWCDAECRFGTTEIPESSLSAAVDNGMVNFELSSAILSNSNKRLIIEHLNGDIAYSIEMTSSIETVELPAGVYRAYVQLHSENSASSTPRIEVFID